MDKEKVKEILQANGISPSYQRIKIFEYLANTKAHPTVEAIYKEVISEIPTLSKTTVYNTLNLFIEKGIAIIITIDEGEARYDADIKLHGHFKCLECGVVEDVEIDLGDKEIEELKEYEIKEKHIYFRGKCKKCKEKI